MAKQKKKTTKTKKVKKVKTVSDHVALDQTAIMLQEFAIFLEGIERYRNNSKYSKNLLKNIFETWSTAAGKDEVRKHQASLIKGFADFMA